MSLRKFEKLFCGVAAVAVGWWGCGCGATKRAVAKHGALAATALEVAARLEATEGGLPAAAAAAQRLGLGEGGQRRAAHSKRMQAAAAGGEGAALLPSGGGGGLAQKLAAESSRPFLNSGAVKWPKTGDYYEVPYEFASEYTDEEMDAWHWVVAEMQYFTNIHFVDRKDSKDAAASYLKVYRANRGCTALYGTKPNEAARILSLDTNCMTRQEILRLLVVVLGFEAFDGSKRGVLRACDIAAIYKEYPGPIEPPLCDDNVGEEHPSMCEPLPACQDVYSEWKCDSECSLFCDRHTTPYTRTPLCKLRPFSEIEEQYTYHSATPSEKRAEAEKAQQKQDEEQQEEEAEDGKVSAAAGRRPLWLVTAAGLWPIWLAAGGFVR